MQMTSLKKECAYFYKKFILVLKLSFKYDHKLQNNAVMCMFRNRKMRNFVTMQNGKARIVCRNFLFCSEKRVGYDSFENIPYVWYLS